MIELALKPASRARLKQGHWRINQHPKMAAMVSCPGCGCQYAIPEADVDDQGIVTRERACCPNMKTFRLVGYGRPAATRDHRLRQRRHRLKLSQYTVGLVAFPKNGSSGQAYVSSVECGTPVRPHHVQEVRRAIVQFELGPRREREQRRRLDRAIWLPRTIESERLIIDHMIDALRCGEEAEFDRVAALVGTAIAKRAGDEYLDGV